MKKLLLFLFPIILCPSLSACQDKTHSITPIHVLGDETQGIEITPDHFAKLYESGHQFAVEFYSPYCSHCEELNPKIEKYMSETKNLIYRFDLTKFETLDEQEEFISKYSNVITDEYVPAIRFISQKTLTYEVESSKFESYTKLRRILNGHFLSSPINIASSKKSVDEFLKNKSSYLVYGYDLDNESSISLAAKNIITQGFVSKDIRVLLLNFKDFDTSEYETIKNYYGALSNNFIARVDNNETIKVADYTASDFNFSDFC